MHLPKDAEQSVKVLQLKQTSKSEVYLRWDDGHEGPVSLGALRDACPCAGCNGETVLLRTYSPAVPRVDTPGRYEMKSVTPIGSYALKFSWGDGHDLGIYTWEHLRGLCECDTCLKGRRVRG